MKEKKDIVLEDLRYEVCDNGVPTGEVGSLEHIIESCQELQKKEGKVERSSYSIHYATSRDESIRPWGHYVILLSKEYCKVKKIVVKPLQRLSYQYHKHRQEAWTIVQGVARVTLNGKNKDYQVGETALIGLGDKHRMSNPSNSEDMILIEVQTGTYFGEDDIFRIEDDYNRS